MRVDQDVRWMTEAVAEASRGLGRTAPNPAVGCVIVRRGRVLGRGWHRKAGSAHAEVDALATAGNVCGATMYVTLEPCSHVGRTGPCADAVTAAGIKRVVVGSRDPNPKVAGRGIRKLRRAGVTVDVGICTTACAELIVGFSKHVRTGTPWVHLKLAASLDGRIATRSGASKWISSPASRQRVQVMRGRSDAILVGAGTVRADDPRLNCRLKGTPSPLRVILDPHLRVRPTDRVVVGSGQCLVVTHPGATSARKQRRLVVAGAEVLELNTRDRKGWERLLRELGSRGVMELLVEGGSSVAASAIRAQVVDRLTVFYNPRLIGGDGVPMIESLAVSDPGQGPRLKPRKLEEVDGDILWSGDFE